MACLLGRGLPALMLLAAAHPHQYPLGLPQFSPQLHLYLLGQPLKLSLLELALFFHLIIFLLVFVLLSLLLLLVEKFNITLLPFGQSGFFF